jgi:hypothetical protein
MCSILIELKDRAHWISWFRGLAIRERGRWRLSKTISITMLSSLKRKVSDRSVWWCDVLIASPEWCL